MQNACSTSGTGQSLVPLLPDPGRQEGAATCGIRKAIGRVCHRGVIEEAAAARLPSSGAGHRTFFHERSDGYAN